MRRNQFSLFLVVLLVVVSLTSTGCVASLAQLMYVMHGYKVDPVFPGLKDKRVAVVCVANTASQDSNSPAGYLANTVEEILRQRMKKEIKLVRQGEIQKWMDSNSWDHGNYLDIGRGVKAQMVLAIDLDNLRLHEDQTLFRGRSNVKLTVYDMSQKGDDAIVFTKTMADFTFPQNGGQHVSETSEAKFQQRYLSILAIEIAKNFYAYEAMDDVATDARLLGQ